MYIDGQYGHMTYPQEQCTCRQLIQELVNYQNMKLTEHCEDDWSFWKQVLGKS